MTHSLFHTHRAYQKMNPLEKAPNGEEDPEDEIVRELPPSPINDGCRTPIRKRQLPSAEKVESVPIIDLAQSPKRRKRSIGITPYSRTTFLSPYPLASRTPTKGSILDIQMGKHTLGSPLPSPKPLPVITPPQSPLVKIVRRANELVKNLSNQANSQSSVKSDSASSVSNSRSDAPTSPLKTMLSSSNSRSLMVDLRPCLERRNLRKRESSSHHSQKHSMKRNPKVESFFLTTSVVFVTNRRKNIQ